MKTFPMSLREVNQISVFERLVSKNLKQKEAAKMLNLSVRQIRKKLRKFRELGPISLIHALRGRPANNQLDKRLVVQAISLVKEKYPDFGPTFASEKLWENHRLTPKSRRPYHHPNEYSDELLQKIRELYLRSGDGKRR